MTNQKLETQEINGFTFVKPKFKKEWVISGVDICQYLGYKNPDQQAQKIYNKYKDYFSKSSCVLELNREVARVSSLDRVAKHKRSIPTLHEYRTNGCFKKSCS